MSDWFQKRLGEVAPFKYGKALREEQRQIGAYPVYSSAGICGFSDEILASKGIVVGRKGTAGSVFYSDLPFFCIDTAFYIDEVFEDCDMKFIYYYMQLMNLGSFNNDAAVPGLNRNLAHKLKLSTPNFSTQTRIADILSAYDDAIENNNRRIALLEQAARELYREWFVRMRFPGHETVKFVNGLPEGWEIRRLGEFGYITDGTHDTPKESESGVPLVTGKCIKGGFIDFNSAYLINEADHKVISRRSGLDSGDILLSNIGTVGSICVVNYDREFSVKNVIILKPSSSTKTAYLYYLLTSSYMQDILSAQTNGASQQFVGLTFMRRFKILVPNEPVMENFAKQITPILAEKQLLYTKSLNLAHQRDMLLPRLMSGKLEV